MAESYKCTHCQAEFKSAQGLANHIKFKHPEGAEKNHQGERAVPDVVNDFELLLKDYGIKKAGLLAKHIADTGSRNVLDNPKQMAGYSPEEDRTLG